MDPDVTCASGGGCPVVVQCWTDLQSVHGLRSYGNITRTRNVSEYMLVLSRDLRLAILGHAPVEDDSRPVNRHRVDFRRGG